MRLKLLLAFALCAGCRNPIKTIAVTPADLKLGDTAKISVQSDAAENEFTVTIGTRTYPMFKASATTYETFWGVSAVGRPGSYDLLIKHAGGSRVLGTYTVVVSSRAFPFENVSLPEEKAKLAQDPAFDASQEKIIAALSTVSPQRFWEGPFDMPAQGRRTTIYGMRRTINKTMAWPYHRGWDIAAPRGTPVKAANAGRVLVAERFPVDGRAVIVDHGQGVLTIYMHLSAFNVAAGAMVKKGDRLGNMGSDGFSTGPHVHWGVYVFGEPVDPQDWLTQAW
jgi:lysostaphin